MENNNKKHEYQTPPPLAPPPRPLRSELSGLLAANVRVLILGFKSMASVCNADNIEYYKGKADAFNKAASMLEDVLNRSS